LTAPHVLVTVYLRSPEQAALVAAYQQTSWATDALPGLLRSELIRDVDDPTGYAVVSEWSNLAAFRAWQEGPDHAGKPSALRPFQDRDRTPHYAVCETVATAEGSGR
jgi:heme-degrading monooxygenase HmoA